MEVKVSVEVDGDSYSAEGLIDSPEFVEAMVKMLVDRMLEWRASKLDEA